MGCQGPPRRPVSPSLQRWPELSHRSKLGPESSSRHREQHRRSCENECKHYEWGTAYRLAWPKFGWEVGRGLMGQAEQFNFTKGWTVHLLTETRKDKISYK